MTAPRELLLGLVGRAGSGKDTAALALRRHGWHRLAFADSLREELQFHWNVDPRRFTDRYLKELPTSALSIAACNDAQFVLWCVRALDIAPADLQAPRSARWVMQRWGTDYRRGYDPDYWLKDAQHRIHRLRGGGVHRIVVTDVRFANEAAFVRGTGGSVVRVHRPELSRLAADTARHASEAEAELIQCADVIHNDGSLDALAAETERVAFSLFGPQAVPNAVVWPHCD